MERNELFTIKKVSNYGTVYPFIARLKVQPRELIQWAELSEPERGQVLVVYFEVADRYIKCHEAAARLFSAVEVALKDIKPSSNARVMHVPYAIGVNAEVETFLYEAKNYLRDLLKVMNIFFGTSFIEASQFFDADWKSYDAVTVTKWAAANFGADDPFTLMLSSESVWISNLIQNRNAVEHPGGKSGTLHIDNIQPAPNGRFFPPLWHRDQNPPTSLIDDIRVIMDNLLTLAEDLLVSCIHHKTRFGIVRFVEVPEQERNPECPVRLRATLDVTPRR